MSLPHVCDVCYLDVDEYGRFRHAQCEPPAVWVTCPDCSTRVPGVVALVEHYQRTDNRPSQCHRAQTRLESVR